MVKTSPGLFPRPLSLVLVTVPCPMSQAKAMPMCWLLVMPMPMTHAKAMPRAMAMARVTAMDKPMAQALG